MAPIASLRGLRWSAPVSSSVRTFNGGRATPLAKHCYIIIVRDGLAQGAMHHVGHFGPFTQQSFLKDQGAMILCQLSCRQAGLLLTPLAPLSTAQSSRGVKGTAGAVDGTRLDSEERKWESKCGYGLHIIQWKEGNRPDESLREIQFTISRRIRFLKRHLLYMHSVFLHLTRLLLGSIEWI